MNILILGDKYEKGMKSKGCQALIKYKGSRIIDYQIEYFQKNTKHNNIVYVSGFDSKALSSYLCKKKYDNLYVLYNPNYATTNYGDSLSIAKKYLNDNCIITFGNTIFSHINIKAIDHTKSCVFTAKQNDNKKNSLGCISDRGIITNIDFDLDNQIHNDIFHISKLDAQKIQTMMDNIEVKNNFIFELINKLIDNGSIFVPIK